MTLQRYQCHKIVSAGRIRWMDPASPVRWFDVEQAETPDRGTQAKRVYVEPSFTARGVPSLGDYYVVYDDAYASWSPKKAFEEGYSALKPEEPARIIAPSQVPDT